MQSPLHTTITLVTPLFGADETEVISQHFEERMVVLGGDRVALAVHLHGQQFFHEYSGSQIRGRGSRNREPRCLVDLRRFVVLEQDFPEEGQRVISVMDRSAPMEWSR